MCIALFGHGNFGPGVQESAERQKCRPVEENQTGSANQQEFEP